MSLKTNGIWTKWLSKELKFVSTTMTSNQLQSEKSKLAILVCNKQQCKYPALLYTSERLN